jgi:hypothetical protein
MHLALRQHASGIHQQAVEHRQQSCDLRGPTSVTEGESPPLVAEWASAYPSHLAGAADREGARKREVANDLALPRPLQSLTAVRRTGSSDSHQTETVVSMLTVSATSGAAGAERMVDQRKAG